MPHERCHRCHAILTSEDRYHYGDKCETCVDDGWYSQQFDYYPIRCAGRYIRYQVRWLSSVAHHGGSLLLRCVRRFMGGNGPKFRHDRRR